MDSLMPYNVDVRAVWDGQQHHAVRVNISLAIEPRPNTRLALLDVATGYVNNATVQNITILPDMAQNRISNAVRQHSSELSGDTLTTAGAHDFLETLRLDRLDDYGTEIDETVTSKCNIGSTANLPWQLMNESPVDPLDVTNAYNTFETPRLESPWKGTHQVDEVSTLKRSRRLFPTRRSEASPTVFSNCTNPGEALSILEKYAANEEESRSSSGGTVEIHRPVTPSPLAISYNESLGSPESLPSPLAYKDQPLPGLADGHGMRGVDMRKPWKSPSRDDFPLNDMFAHSPSWSFQSSPAEGGITPTTTPSMISAAKGKTWVIPKSKSSVQFAKPRKDCGDETLRVLSKPKQQRYTVGRARGKKFETSAQDEMINVRRHGGKPLFARSCLNFPSWSPDGIDKEFNKASLRIRSSSFDEFPADQSSLDQVLSDQNPFSYEEKTSLQYTDRSCSPDTFPKMWSRSDESKSQYSLRSASRPFEASTDASWAVEDGKLYILLGHNVPVGSYLIDVEASVNLSEADATGWQSFHISGLPAIEGKDFTGRVEFFLEHETGDSELPDIQFDTTLLLDAHRLRSKKLVGRFPVVDPLQLRLRVISPVYYVEHWDTAVTLCSHPIWSEEKGIYINHHARLTFNIPNKDNFAEKISFSIFIKNGPQEGCIRVLGNDECSVFLGDCHERQSESESEIEIVVLRSVRDLEKALDLYFALSYPGIASMTVTLPTFRPKMGRVLSEVIWIAETSPSLTTGHLAQGPFSTWSKTEHVEGNDSWLRLDRVKTSPLFPDGLKDNAMFKIKRLRPVSFKALEIPDDACRKDNSANVARDLDIRIERVMGEELECRMSLRIQAGSSSRLLTIDNRDWILQYAIINGRLATEQTGEWRECGERSMTLLKSSEMVLGQVLELEMHWKDSGTWGSVNIEDMEDAKVDYGVPRIVGTVVLSQNDGSERAYGFLDLYGLDNTKLPTLYEGYDMRLLLRRPVPASTGSEHPVKTVQSSQKLLFSGGRPLVLRSVRFADEVSDDSSGVSDTTSLQDIGDGDVENDIASFINKKAPITLEDETHSVTKKHITRDETLVLPQQRSRPAGMVKRSSHMTAIWFGRLMEISTGFIFLWSLLLTQDGHGGERLHGMQKPPAVESFNPNNFISDLLPWPEAVQSWYHNKAADFGSHFQASTVGSLDSGTANKRENGKAQEIIGQDKKGEGSSSTINGGGNSRSTDLSYLDWLDRALGWKEPGKTWLAIDCEERTIGVRE